MAREAECLAERKQLVGCSQLMAFPLHESDSRCVLHTLPAYAHVILRAASKGTFGHDLHLIDKEIKAQRGGV